MSIHDETIAKIVLFAVLFIPLAMSVKILIKALMQQVVRWKHSREKESLIGHVVPRIVLTITMLIIAMFMGVILICVFWFPDYHIPFFLRLSVLILIIPYLGCMCGLAYGLSSVVAIANVSSAQIFSELFRIRSKSTSETTQKAEKPKIANNSESG